MKIIQFLLVLFITTTTINAQKLTKKQLDSLPNTVENQFLKIYSKANTWNEYKMIRRVDFIPFQKRILDSITALKKDISVKQEQLVSVDKNMAALNGKISELNNQLTAAKDSEDKISFLGSPISKVTYNTILWSIIVGLLSALFFFIFKFKNSHTLTKEAKLSLDEVEQEFDQFRKKSIEREQKIRRQLQDEINKQRGV